MVILTVWDQGSFFAPYVGNDLDSILLEMGGIWDKMNSLPADDSEALRFLQQQAIFLNHRLSHWQNRLPADFMPIAAGQIAPGPNPMSPEPGYWPGAIDVYFDLYVAGVWNTLRVARCFLIDIIITIADTLQDGKDYARERADASHLCKKLLSSIPYHLTECLPEFLRETERASEIQTPGRAVGGLLLMHPMFVLRQLSIVPLEIREYLTRCLEWIGMNMGVGQASNFAKVRKGFFYSAARRA